jgi:D-alanyl-D-alanine carboxypeptidase
MLGTQRQRRTVFLRPATLAYAFFALVTALPAAARAQIGSDRYASIVVDAGTGNVLEEANPDAPRHPASLAKLMTLYMTFEALRDRRISNEELVPVSAHAASMQPSKLGIQPGTQMTVQEAILGLVTKSANDAAAALGEMLGGSEDRFAQMMTLRARALGMSRTTFTNASGLPDPDQWSTARDLAILARHLLTDFPSFYPYFSTPSFTFHHRIIFNHDRMLQSYPGADGMKTGYTEASGHNLVTSAARGGVRLIGVVLGANSNGERDIHMAALLNQGFEQLDVPIDRRAPPSATMVANHLPSLVSSAHAAPPPDPPPPSRQIAHGHAMPPASLWGIQVGSFATEQAARDAAIGARRNTDGGDARIEPTSQHGRTTWRAQVMGLSAAEAQNACAALARHRTPCIVLRLDQRQVASR